MASDVHKSVWKYISLPDYSLLLKAVTASIGMTVCFVYLTGLQHGIALSVPVIQWAVVVFMMIALRMGVCYIRWSGKDSARFHDTPKENIIILGLSDIAGLYLHWARKIAKERVNVIGILDEVKPLKGRQIQSCEVIGGPVDLPQILARYKIHGVVISRVIVTVPFESLSREAQSILAYYQASGDLRFDFLDDSFKGGIPDSMDEEQVSSTISMESRETVQTLHAPFYSNASVYPMVKRSLDIALSLLLLITISPFILLIGLMVLIDLGYPVSFWQQRLGKDGRSFWLYKFRTMSDGVDKNGITIPDTKRMSAFGLFLRRARLDEILQLYNILIGEMSFIGPRPLLPVDQPHKCKSRLLVRPGLTGWAQVNGGRAVSREDKAVLDLWYLRNVSPWLDFKILIMTAWMLIFGEHLNKDVIRRARIDLGHDLGKGIVGAGYAVSASAKKASEAIVTSASKQKVA